MVYMLYDYFLTTNNHAGNVKMTVCDSTLLSCHGLWWK